MVVEAALLATDNTCLILKKTRLPNSRSAFCHLSGLKIMIRHIIFMGSISCERYACVPQTL